MGNEAFWDRLFRIIKPFVVFASNTISLIGVVLTTSTFFAIAVSLLTGEYGYQANPYITILTTLILPGIFVFGLILIPVGIWLKRRRTTEESKLPSEYPLIDLNVPKLRKILGLLALATMLNAFIFIFATYQGIQYMDSASFCGEACHTVMQPEFAAYPSSPHANVDCIRCHIGSKTSTYLQHKMAGIGKVFATASGNYALPLQTKLTNLHPSNETCQQCHEPSHYVGSVIKVKKKYQEDEANTLTWTILQMHVGGGNGRSRGVHSTHLDLADDITYLATDDHRQTIPWVRYRTAGGEVREYATPDWDGDFSKGQLRKMDCIDCHNRPAHAFESPAEALDNGLSSGQIAPSLPFVKMKAKEFLMQPYATQGEGADAIVKSLTTYYQTTYPQVWETQRDAVELATSVAQDIYRRNVFPERRVGWGTYPNNLSHQDFPGCFRCHDGSHVGKNNTFLTQDCNTCHSLIAIEEEKPSILEKITDLQ